MYPNEDTACASINPDSIFNRVQQCNERLLYILERLNKLETRLFDKKMNSNTNGTVEPVRTSLVGQLDLTLSLVARLEDISVSIDNGV